MGVNNQEEVLALIARNLAGVADTQDIFNLNIWIESSKENRKYFEQVLNIWDVSSNSFKYDNIDTEKALKETLERITNVPGKKTFWFYWQKVAAILIIPLLIASLYWIVSTPRTVGSGITDDVVYNVVHAAFGTRSELALSDSTRVWINSGSSLKYPVKFDENNRKVFLSGEAYFEVESDETRPFIVETNSLQVKATGTKFNVQEYNNSHISEVMLLSGKLIVNESDSVNPRIISELIPNQYLSYNRDTREKYVKDEDVARYVAWKDGKLIFRNEPLEKVINKLSMMFNVDIDLQGQELKKYRYHATFQDESLEEILKLLRWSAPLSFKEVKREPLPDGSFSKKRVIIYPSEYIRQNN